jgi:16S rRNA (guanine966-N2)-methyltransferase
MRIIAGRYRGRKLAEYYCESTRPTTDRIKENVFNLLSNLIEFDGCSVLDLFAGTGQYGIECISRGAKFVSFCDNDTRATSIIKKNLTNIQGNFVMLNKDYKEVLSNGGRYDLVFLDPPYNSSLGEDTIKMIIAGRLLKPNGVIILETDKEIIDFGFNLHVTVKKYGRVFIYLIHQ